jgi:hypothetical protein
MTKHIPFRIKCDSISYRQGFIEVIPAIHEGCVNIETWQLEPSTSLNDMMWVDEPPIPDGSVSANTELELTAAQACELAEALLAAARSMKTQIL